MALWASSERPLVKSKKISKAQFVMWLCGPLKQLVYGNMPKVFSARYKITSFMLAYLSLQEKLLMEFCFGSHNLVKQNPYIFNAILSLDQYNVFNIHSF